MAALAGLLWFRLPQENALQTAALYALGAAGVGALVLMVVGALLLKRTGEQQNRVERDLLEAFLEYIPDNVFFKDRDSRFVRISRAMADRCGLADPANAVNKTDADIFSSEHADQAFSDEQEIIRTGEPMIAKEEKETWPDGHETWVATTKVPLKDRRGEIVGTMGIAHDITTRRQAELRIRYLALHDPLTGLPNRILLEDRLSQAIAMSGRSQKRVGVLMLDLNRFKDINDCYGHFVGDRLLEGVTVRLKACLRESDTVARVAGDQFAIAMPLVATIDDIERVAHKVQTALADPFEIEGHELQITASIGMCQYPNDGENPNALVQAADAAMYEAKRRGLGTHCFFSPALTQATRRRQKMESDLRQACERDEFVVYYQPFVSTQTGRITGVEALLRWRHPEQGLISPSHFIPQLEEIGWMVEVGRWVLRTACRQNVSWQRDGISPIRMAVNVSSQQFFEGSILETVKSVLHETKLDPKWLELELTESRVLDDPESTVKIMRELKQIGVSLSLDDFGTGWSSLTYLRCFPVNRIKIDQSFIRDLASQPAAEAVVKSILSLGRNLGIACIAEGVETRQQRDYLKKQMCTEMQGFLFGKPLPAADCTAFLRSANAGTVANSNQTDRLGMGAGSADQLASTQIDGLADDFPTNSKWNAARNDTNLGTFEI
jgi:diguanylate cyclase (GGDEF)-like protein/PAS domain S-box-containing protein